MNFNTSFEEIIQAEGKINFLKHDRHSLRLFEKFTWIKEIKELFDRICSITDLDSLLSINQEEKIDEYEEVKLILEI